jgi:hypothetical protein
MSTGNPPAQGDVSPFAARPPRRGSTTRRTHGHNMRSPSYLISRVRAGERVALTAGLVFVALQLAGCVCSLGMQPGPRRLRRSVIVLP